ncbi:MAG: Gfo/Idh/MocA family oxidoreductase [Bacteroidetes bacterium]|nr:Gfo/Idh/MocA family oxidoreductase [Bacteroidota bacterium]MBX7130203.1 Gfo/Idh/MocA family oxidoreductase [Flavobacteriales bacterium]MCC6655648.1 Gfo/Idh/MocA family oxidoreductase [Flavobacteriales bacterium]HNE80263.1 Gfo/Idh/MocA family oxidoreductase [Flavobacteriales bacterium]HNK42053.1 Gfo/Idh/MocA family oxidoreductase [Flavobacteriales bacterium]
MSSPIKFGVVGCGHIGKRHAEMVKRHPEAELVAVCDPLPASETKADQFGVPVFADLETMLRETPDLDVVNVCTPNGLHARQSLIALEARKHVVCEKPMGLSKAECEEVLYKALQMHRTVFGVMQNRYSPPSQWIKSVIDQKLLGDIFLVQVNCYWNRDDRYYKKGGWKGTGDLDGGTLFTQFSHFIDIMYWLFGDITDIHARFADFNHQGLTDFEDSGLVTFRFVNGGMGCINYSTSVWDKNLESSLTVIGSKGSVKVGGQYMDQVEHCHIKDYVMPSLAPTNPANDYGAYKGSANNHSYIIENVVDTIKGRSTLTTNALEGLKVVEIIERIYKLKK